MYYIQVIERSGEITGPWEGFPEADYGDQPVYVASYDPNSHDGHGSGTWTTDINEAIGFESALLALIFYRQTSTVRPMRQDGNYNRPLTVFTVSIEQVPKIDYGGM